MARTGVWKKQKGKRSSSEDERESGREGRATRIRWLAFSLSSVFGFIVCVFVGNHVLIGSGFRGL
jgi:hypothetical protein